MGHPVLLREAEPVDDPTHPEIRRLIADMAETMQDASGIGLAAPQVHVPLRLFVWRGTDRRVSVLVNPVLEPAGGGGRERLGGLPVHPRPARLRHPAEAHPLPRPGRRGQPGEGEADGMTARVMQHETDHLDGVMYPMRMQDLSLFGFTEELARAAGSAGR